MLEAEHITESVAARQGYRRRPDYGGVEKHDGEHRSERRAVLAQQVRQYAGWQETSAAFGGACSPGAGHHQSGRADHHHEGPQGGVDSLVADEARRDAFVDDVGLLKEQLPWRHRGADDSDDQQHRIGRETTGHTRYDKGFRRVSPVRMRHHQHRNLQQGDRDENQHRALPTAEAAGGHDGDQCYRGERDYHVSGYADVIGGQRDADEFRYQSEEIQQKQVADGKPTPAPAKPFVDQSRMPDSGDGTEPDHHFLVDDEHRDQQQQHPQQAVPVVLPGLHIGCDTARVVVADHHDQAGPDNRQQSGESRCERARTIVVAQSDPAQRALDVANVGAVQYRGG